MSEVQNHLLSIFENKKTELIQLYITERQRYNELGALFNFTKGDELKSVFYPISDPIVSEETKKDIIEKNNYRNTYAFFFFTDVPTNTTILTIEDLDSKV
jgi:hypothetical protein